MPATSLMPTCTSAPASPSFPALKKDAGLSPRTDEIVGLLVARAKLDRKGVFWTVASPYRQSNPAVFENALGFGTPGILLTLLEYYRLTQHAEVAELLLKGGAWVAHRAQNSAFQHGYYGGTAGLWHLFTELEKDFPGIAPQWFEHARAALAACPRGDHQGNLATGVAGTIIGSLDALERSGQLGPEIPPLLADLLAAAKPSPEGVFWDFNPTAIRPPAGFLQGNAGVDFCLAHVRNLYGLSYPSLLAGSLEYAGSLFDAEKGNWLDQDAAVRLRQMKPAEVEKMVAQDDAEKFARTFVAEDSIGWATGTAGILLARSTVARAYRDTPPGRLAREDCQRAIQRLARTSDADLERMDSSLLHGLPGLALALEGCREFLPPPDFAPLEGLWIKLREQLAARQAVIADDDLSLLGGVAGLAYAQMAVTGALSGRNCLVPFRRSPVADGPPVEQRGDLSPFLERRLPAVALHAEVRATAADSTISLRTLAAAVATTGRDSVPVQAARHELGLYAALAATRFHELFWQELVKRTHFSQRYAEGMDEQLFFERFRLDDCATLLELDFDPYARTPQPEGSKLVLLRHTTSGGVKELKLSALQHALLQGFLTPAVALDVIRTVIRRVENPNVTQRQLADLSRKMIRAFVQAGYLVAHSPGKIEAWTIRRRLKDVRQTLFPAGAGPTPR
jgi:hypothetical protein